jgi:hypothetical protein
LNFNFNLLTTVSVCHVFSKGAGGLRRERVSQLQLQRHAPRLRCGAGLGANPGCRGGRDE